MRSKLEEHDIVFVPSKPFQKFVVCTPDNLSDGSSGTADLTLWDPTEEQQEALKEGHCVRMRNIAVKDSKYEGRLQLIANTRTQMTCVDTNGNGHFQPRTHNRIGLFKIHTLSKTKSTQSLIFSLAAIVVETTITTIGTHYLLTDRSGLVLRLECFNDGQESPFSSSSPFPVLIFQRLCLMDFDSYSNCAVAEFAPDSSIGENASDPGVRSIRKWLESDNGRNRMSKLAPYIQAKLRPFHALEASTSLIQSIGYMKDFVVLSGGQLVIQVDCIAAGIQSWSFPLALISRLKYLRSQERNIVVLSGDEERRLAQLSSLDCIVRIKSLLRFVLQRKSGLSECQCQHGVVDVSLANVSALNRLYSQALLTS